VSILSGGAHQTNLVELLILVGCEAGDESERKGAT
jgi:hypothetical protein